MLKFTYSLDSNMNILIVNHYAGSKTHGMEFRPYYFAQEWIRAGHNVTIIASSFSHLRSVQPKCPKRISIELIDNIKYVWLKTKPYQGNGFKRVLNMVSFSWQLWSKILPVEVPDVVIDSSTYPLTIFASNKIAKRYRAKLIFEVHDLWPLTPLELGGFSEWHPFIMVMQRAENYAYKNADRVVSLLPKAKGHMIAHGMAAEKFLHIPNGANLPSFKSGESLPEKHSELIKELKRRGNFIVGYAGGHGISNALQYLILAAEKIEQRDKTHFVLVGQGSEKEALQNLSRKLSLSNVTFLSPIPKTSIPTLLSEMDVLYIGWKREPLYRFGVSPNKLIDYMMAAKPIIHSIDASNDLVAESGCGISIGPEDPQTIADAILHLFKLSQEARLALGQKGYDYVTSHLDYAVLANEFLERL